MRSRDIPQDATPPRIRNAVAAVAAGARDPQEVAARTGLSLRHVHYHLHQAARVLGFVEQAGGWFTVTPLGQEWLSTPEQSAADRAVFAHALEGSPSLHDISSDLLAETEPDAERLGKRIGLLGKTSPETAKRRAQTLLRWRRYARADEPPDLSGAARPRQAIGPALDPADRGRPIRCLQVRNYGCLRDARAVLGSFSVVVGANAAGKTTLLDLIGFTAEALQTDISKALLERVAALEELLWFGQGQSFQFALEFSVPRDLVTNGHTDARYELEVGRDAEDREARVLAEGLFLKDASIPDDLIHTDKTPKGWRKVVGLNRAGTAFYRSERTAWKTVFQSGSRKLALSQVQEDRDRFPVALWVKSVLLGGVQRLELNSKAMRRPASPLLVGKFLPDGSNLPIVVRHLRAREPKRFREWVKHVSEALPDLKDIRVVERDEDKHAYLKLVYDGGLELPAWRVSDGTLRLLALTLIAFIDVRDAVYLIEEPENGIHPQALEVAYQALSHCYDSQVLVATHSPVFLSIVPPERFLILSKEGGETRITCGREHPVLGTWQREADLGTLFASGVLT